MVMHNRPKPHSKTAQRKTGDTYEQQACRLLIEQGLQICHTNYTVAGVGEIDIIATEQTSVRGKIMPCLVFVEVRFRRQSQFVDAIGSITPTKQRRIINTAMHFLQSNTDYQAWSCRFDVVGFTQDKAGNVACEWLKGAFDVQ